MALTSISNVKNSSFVKIIKGKNKIFLNKDKIDYIQASWDNKQTEIHTDGILPTITIKKPIDEVKKILETNA